MKALITGGAGFAGSHLAEYLLSQGQEVIVLTREGDAVSNVQHLLACIRMEWCDVLDERRLRQVLVETRPERIYHLAAASSPLESLRNPRLVYEVNFTGTLNLLLAWRDVGIDSRLLYVSSSQVYGSAGDSGSLPAREDTPLRPASPYAGSKAAAEMLALQFFYGCGLPIVRVRPFNHTGPRQMPNYVCSSFARQIAEIDLSLRPPVISVGNLSAGRDFSDVRDVVRGYYLLLEKGDPGEVYQLGSGRVVSIESVLQTLVGSASKPIQVSIDEAKLRPEEPRMVCGDPSKARIAVGWRPQYSLRTTLEDLRLYWEGVLAQSSHG